MHVCACVWGVCGWVGGWMRVLIGGHACAHVCGGGGEGGWMVDEGTRWVACACMWGGPMKRRRGGHRVRGGDL